MQDVASGKLLVVTYNQVEADAISGAVKYVDVDGNIIDTEIVENLGAGKEVAIKKSFFKTTTEEAGQETDVYKTQESYRLAITDAPLPNSSADEFHAVISGSFLSEIASLPKTESPVSLALSDNQIVVRIARDSSLDTTRETRLTIVEN